MRLSQRSFPHPVVGNRDDVPTVAFQATVEMTADRVNIYLDVSVICSSEVLRGFIQSGAALFSTHVECSNTLFRKLYTSSSEKFRITIPADNLNDSVEVNTFIKATRRISNYRLPEAHSDYGATAFEIKKGDILALGEGYVFPVESVFDALGTVGSIMQIQEAAEEGDCPMRVEFGAEKIIIYLSKADFADYKLLKSHEGVLAPLTVTIVLPVLMEAIIYMRSSESGGEEDERRWQRVLRRRLKAEGLSENDESLQVAQKILEYPIKRALASAHLLAEQNS